MNFRQKISLFAAAMLPVLALAAYFLLTPPRASAQSCPGGRFRSACGPGGTGCNSGTGVCYSNGTEGWYIYCPNSQGGHPGLGVCEDGYTCCIQ